MRLIEEVESADYSGGATNLIKDIEEAYESGEIDEELRADLVRRVVLKLEERLKDAEKKIFLDELTHISNRRLLEKKFRERNKSQSLCLLMFDIDNFKKVNDHYGHVVGDQVLQEVAQIMRRNARKKDEVIRYGGEEYAVVLPGTELKRAKVIGERLVRAVRESKIETDAGEVSVTISCGVAKMTKHESLKKLVDMADKGLYEAKKTGKDKLCMLGRKSVTCTKTK